MLHTYIHTYTHTYTHIHALQDGAGAGAGGGEAGEGLSADVDAAGASGGAAKGPLLSFAKATFAAEGSDQALDLNDPSFWEKVLGPKPAQRLLSDVTQGKLDHAPADTVSAFLSELRELVQEMLARRLQGGVHEEAEAITAILVELQVRGKHIRLPYAAAPTAVSPGSTGGGGDGGSDVGPVSSSGRPLRRKALGGDDEDADASGDDVDDDDGDDGSEGEPFAARFPRCSVSRGVFGFLCKLPFFRRHPSLSSLWAPTAQTDNPVAARSALAVAHASRPRSSSLRPVVRRSPSRTRRRSGWRDWRAIDASGKPSHSSTRCRHDVIIASAMLAIAPR